VIIATIPDFIWKNSQVTQTAQVLVKNHKGETLGLYYIDPLTRKILYSYTEQISDDPYETVLTLPDPQLDNIQYFEIVITAGSTGINTETGEISSDVESIRKLVAYAEQMEVGIGSDYKECNVWIMSKDGMSWYQSYTPGLTTITTLILPKDDLYLKIIHVKYSDTNGRLMIFDGANKVLDISGKSAIIELTFSIDKQIAYKLGQAIESPKVLQACFKVPDLLYMVGALSIIKPLYSMKRFTPLAYSYEITDTDVKLHVITQVDLVTPIDIWGALRVIAGILSIIGGGILLFVSGGVSAPLSWLMIASGISAIATGVATLYEEFRVAPTSVLQHANDVVNNAKDQINKQVEDLQNYLNQLVSEGKLTQDEANAVMTYVDNIRNIAFKAFDELKEAVKNAYDEGYKKALSDMEKWIIASGTGGFVVGLLVGRR